MNLILRTKIKDWITGNQKVIVLSFLVFLLTAGALLFLFSEYIFLILGLILLASLLIFSFLFPFYSFLAFIVSLPLEAAFVFEVGFTIRLSYIFLASTIFGLLLSRRKFFLRSPLDMPILFFLSVAVLSLIPAIVISRPEVDLAETMIYRGSEFRNIIQLAILFFFSASYFITVHFCSEGKKFNLVLKTYLFTALIVSFYGIYQLIAVYFGLPLVDITNALSTNGSGYGVLYYSNFSFFRPHATFQEPLNFGHYLLSVIPFSLALYLYKRRTIEVIDNYFPRISLFMISVMLVAFFLAKSQGAWIGLIVSLGFMFYMVGKKHRLKMTVILSILLSFFGLISFFYFPEFFSNTIAKFTSLQSFYPRMEQYFFIFDLWKQYPILGVGIGNYGIHAAHHFSSNLVVGAVGVFQQTLVEMGIIGLLAILLLVFSYLGIMISSLKKSKGTYWYPRFLGLTAGFIAMTIQYLSFDGRFSLYFWVFLGISMATLELFRREQENLKGSKAT